MIKSRIAAKPSPKVAAKAAPKKAAPAPEPEVEEDVAELTQGEALVGYAANVSIARTVRIPIGESWLDSTVTVFDATYEAASARLEEAFSTELPKVMELAEQIAPGASGGEEDVAEDEADADVEAEEGEDGDITEEDVRGMDRASLVSLIDENSLNIDPDDFKKNKQGLDQLREAVVAEAFGGEDEAEAEDETEEAEAEDEAEDGAEEEEAITVEDIKGMERDDLVQLIADNELEVNPKKYPKLSDLRKAVIAAVEAASEDGEEAEAEDEVEEEAEEASEEEAGYSRTELEKMDNSDLKEIYKAWELGKYPAGTPVAQKKLAIKAILAAQEG